MLIFKKILTLSIIVSFLLMDVAHCWPRWCCGRHYDETPVQTTSASSEDFSRDSEDSIEYVAPTPRATTNDNGWLTWFKNKLWRKQAAPAVIPTEIRRTVIDVIVFPSVVCLMHLLRGREITVENLYYGILL